MRRRIICFCLLTCLVMSTSITAFAQESLGKSQKSEVDLQELVNNVKIINDYIESKGTSVLNELYKEKDRLERLLNKETIISRRTKLERLIENYGNMIEEYKFYQNNKAIGSDSIIPYGVEHPILSPAVATIVSFFLTARYYLAAELLTYAKEDAVLDEWYVPVFGGYVYDTDEYDELVDEISNESTGSGSSSFPKGGSVKDNDLYYAIHLYNYEFEYSSLTITDYYDYDVNPDYEGIAGTAINTMYMAQVLGVIVPYNVRIELTR